MAGVPYGSSEAVQGIFEAFFPVVSSTGLRLESTTQGLSSGIETAVSTYGAQQGSIVLTLTAPKF